MVRGYTADVRNLLTQHGCTFLRAGKGDHELWTCPGIARPVVVDGRIMSRHLAETAIDYRPVHDYTLTDDIEYIKPKKRVY